MTRRSTRPRVHRCGCADEIHHPTGARRCVARCAAHRARARDPATLDAAYYAAFGIVDEGGRPRETAHVAQLIDALGPLPGPPPGAADALEVGCGASPYVDFIRAAGYRYRGLDPSAWAVGWLRRVHGAEAWRGDLDSAPPPPGRGYGLILAAHVVEHLPDAPGGVARMAGMLAPGGELWVLVPDDSDPLNPDHLWLFSPTALARCVAAAGLRPVALESRHIVAHERFLYCRARTDHA